MPAESMDGQHAIVFSIMDRAARIYGFTWLIEWSTTSFYVKSTYKPMQTTKISLHGPDPNHFDKQHFRLDFEHVGPADKAIAAGGAWSTHALQLPLYFEGKRINKRAVHIVRFSAEASMYAKGIPSAPAPSPKAKATLHAALAAPPSGKVAHVDLFVSSVRPLWPNEKKVRADDAGMGPIVNSAGLYLTAVNYQVSSTAEPDPFGDVRDGLPIDQCVRGIGERLDPSGFLWICEKMIPPSKVESTSPPPPGGAPPYTTATAGPPADRAQ